jgi:hypothetical protein
VHLTVIGFAIWSRDIFFFPLGITYLTYGIVRAAVVGFVERGEEPVQAEEDEEQGEYPQIVRDPEPRRKRRRRRGGV